MGIIRRTVVVITAAIALAASAALMTAPAASAAPYCGITWGSLPKEAGPITGQPGAYVTGVRSGRHACFDRLVVDVGRQVGGFSVRYVDVVRHDPKGTVVPLRGGARLQVVIGAPSNDLTGRVTFAPANQSEVVAVAGYSTFRQVAWAGSFEGTTTLGLGVRAHLPMRAFVLSGPGTGSRLVVDVAHRW